ncbi:MAG: HEAT repeat domain-containing protein [Bacteroidales bacterium]
MNVLIWSDVRKNISIAQQKYPGTTEEALISFLQDEKNSFNDRTHVAVWTLGMLKSEKALPILKSYYKDDPKGLTSKGHHNQMLCQYGLHKAIVRIEGRWMYSTAGLNR